MSDLMLTCSLPARRFAPGVMLDHPMAAFRLFYRTYVTRRALPSLTTRELADIGVTVTGAATEAARLPWDTAPRRRRHGSGLAAWLQRGLERFRTRRLIMQMQTHDQRDIGLSPSNAQTEASKPFWMH